MSAEIRPYLGLWKSLTAVVRTHEGDGREVREVTGILVAVSRQANTFAVSSKFRARTTMKFNGQCPYLTPRPTGHAIMLCVKANNVAAPGPAGVKGTKPAPSFSLLPMIAGCWR